MAGPVAGPRPEREDHQIAESARAARASTSASRSARWIRVRTPPGLSMRRQPASQPARSSCCSTWARARSATGEAVAARRGEMGRIGHHMVEDRAREAGRRPAEIALDHLDPPAELVLPGVVGSPAAAASAGSRARRCGSPARARPGTGSQRRCRRRRRARSRPRPRAPRPPAAPGRSPPDSPAAGWLEAHPAAEQAGPRSGSAQGVRHRRGRLWPARAGARAVSRWRSSTISRRGIAPMLPSTPLTWSSSSRQGIASAARIACAQDRWTRSLLRNSSRMAPGILY